MGEWEKATQLWSETEDVIDETTDHVNVYNVLTHVATPLKQKQRRKRQRGDHVSRLYERHVGRYVFNIQLKVQDDEKNSQKMKKMISKRWKTVLLTAFTLSMALCVGPLIHPLPVAEKREVRELEKCALKLAKLGCIQRGLLERKCSTQLLKFQHLL